MNAQPATSRLLLCSLADFVRQAVSGYPFPSPDGPWLDCRVFLHGLPEEQDAGTYPFVVVRWAEGMVESEPDGQTILTDTVALLLGVHAPRAQAEAGLLCAELMDVLRRSIWKRRILAGRFELVEPLKCGIPGQKQQIHRFHMATMELVWNYVWPPKALEEAGQSQLTGAGAAVDSYSIPPLKENNII